MNIMKNKARFLSVFFCLSVLVFNSPASAQDEMNWDAKFALGLGFTPSWIFPDYSAVNTQLKNSGFSEFAGSGFIAYGGAGHLSIPVVKNLRIGGMGFGGSSRNSVVIGGVEKQAVYSASLGGFTAEYTLPFIKSVAVSIGAVIGGGSTTVELYRHKDGQFDWGNAWNEAGDSSSVNFYRKFYNSYFTVTPTLNIDIPIYRFLAFRIGGGYQIALDNQWHMDNGIALSSRPGGLKSNWFFIQTGIFIGYFSY